MLKNPFKKISFYKIFVGLFWLIVFLFVWKTAIRYLDPDWGWHLQVGREIAETAEIPQANLYNFSYIGNWVDHEWLFNWVLAKINDFGTYNLVVAFFIGLILSFVFLINKWVKKLFSEKINLYLLMLFELIILYTISPQMGVRCQDIAWIFVLILFLSFTVIENQKKSEKINLIKSILPALIWPPLLYLWACLHGSFLMGLAILSGWWSYQTILLLFSRKLSKIWPDLLWKPFSKKLWLSISILILLSFGFTWITAYGSELYSFLIGYRDNYYLTHISEWLPQSSYPFVYPQMFFIGLVVAILGSWFWKTFIAKQKTNLPIWLGFLNLIFLFMAMKSRRHFPFLAIGSLPFLLDFFNPLINDFLFLYKKYFLRKMIFKIFSVFALVFILVLSFILSSKISFIADPFSRFCNEYPCGAVNFLKQNTQYDQLNIFNEYTWGGFLIATYPERKLFIDGRLPQVQLGEKSFLEEYQNFHEKERIEKQINKYSIGLFLINARPCANFKPAAWELWFFPDLKEIKCQPILQEYLKNNSDWNLIYSDSVSLIYKKNIN